MSDKISKNKVTGVDEMFYIKSEGIPWHSKGTPVEGVLTSKEALVKAGQTWEAEKQEIKTVAGITIPNYRAVVRTDTNTFLGICKEDYRVFQLFEQYDFFDAVVGTGEAIYHTAGCLGNGEQTWIQAKLPGDLLIAPDDAIEKFLLLVSSFDRSLPLMAFYTPQRVVCHNTLNVALRGRKNERGIVIRHSKNMDKKVEEARKVLGLAIQYYSNLEEDFKNFAKFEFKSERNVVEYFEAVIPDNEDAKHTTRTENQRKVLLEIFDKNTKEESKMHKRNLWLGYNAVTEYADHHLSFRETETNTREDNRARSILFGRSKNLKQIAFDEAMKLIK